VALPKTSKANIAMTVNAEIAVLFTAPPGEVIALGVMGFSMIEDANLHCWVSPTGQLEYRSDARASPLLGEPSLEGRLWLGTSKAPEQPRKLAQACAGKIGSAGQKLLLDAAAEIEGSEEAYAVLVCEIRTLREKLAHTEKNLRATLELLPCSPLVCLKS
jgi:hypothetical protein